jgi:hypothetical protein
VRKDCDGNEGERREEKGEEKVRCRYKRRSAYFSSLHCQIFCFVSVGIVEKETFMGEEVRAKCIDAIEWLQRWATEQGLSEEGSEKVVFLLHAEFLLAQPRPRH